MVAWTIADELAALVTEFTRAGRGELDPPPPSMSIRPSSTRSPSRMNSPWSWLADGLAGGRSPLRSLGRPPPWPSTANARPGSTADDLEVVPLALAIAASVGGRVVGYRSRCSALSANTSALRMVLMSSRYCSGKFQSSAKRRASL